MQSQASSSFYSVVLQVNYNPETIPLASKSAVPICRSLCLSSQSHGNMVQGRVGDTKETRQPDQAQIHEGVALRSSKAASRFSEFLRAKLSRFQIDKQLRLCKDVGAIYALGIPPAQKCQSLWLTNCRKTGSASWCTGHRGESGHL